MEIFIYAVVYYVLGACVLAGTDKDCVFYDWLSRDKTRIAIFLWVMLWPITVLFHLLYKRT